MRKNSKWKFVEINYFVFPLCIQDVMLEYKMQELSKPQSFFVIFHCIDDHLL